MYEAVETALSTKKTVGNFLPSNFKFETIIQNSGNSGNSDNSDNISDNSGESDFPIIPALPIFRKVAYSLS